MTDKRACAGGGQGNPDLRPPISKEACAAKCYESPTHISFDRNLFQDFASEINRIHWSGTVSSLLEPLSACVFRDLAHQLVI